MNNPYTFADKQKTYGTVHLSIDGNCGCALVGENLMEGEAEFVCIDDAPEIYTELRDKEKWSMTQAHKRLCDRLGVQLGFYTGGNF